MELAFDTIQPATCYLMALAQVVVTALRVRAIDMVWSDDRSGILGTCVGGLATYHVGYCMHTSMDKTIGGF